MQGFGSDGEILDQAVLPCWMVEYRGSSGGKNYQEAKSRLKITKGREQSLCKPALRKSFMSPELLTAEGQ